uniref:Uncharacterized protein n=1 Tax=Anguilla anguilla TaxID=7936 RepID=A0A0E9RDT1_ANGAN
MIAYVDGTGAAMEEYTTPFEDLRTLFTPKCVPNSRSDSGLGILRNGHSRIGSCTLA